MKKRLKILWLSHLVPYPPKGGALQRACNLVTELSKHHDVHLIAFTRPKVYKLIFGSFEKGLAEANEYLDKICIQTKFIHLPYQNKKLGTLRLLTRGLISAGGYTVNWLDSDDMKKTILEWDELYHFDCVHADTISLVPYKYLLPDTPSTLDHHNIESDMLFTRTRNENNPLKKIYFWQEAIKLQHYEKAHCHNFDYNLTCSELDSERLTRIDSRAITRTIPNGVDIEYFAPLNTPKTPNSMVFAGGLSWYPNIDAMHYLADNIWPIVSEKIPGITMNVIGKSPSKKLQKLANKDPNFMVHGFVDDIRPYVASATIYICPIRDGGGTKLKILDALAMGCAIIAHPMAIEGIDLKHGENVLLATSPEEFVDQIVRLTTDEALQCRLSENGRRVAVEKYSYVNIGIKLADTFFEIV